MKTGKGTNISLSFTATDRQMCTHLDFLQLVQVEFEALQVEDEVIGEFLDAYTSQSVHLKMVQIAFQAQFISQTQMKNSASRTDGQSRESRPTKKGEKIDR